MRVLSALLLASCAQAQLEVLPGAGPGVTADPKIYGGDAPDQPYHDAVVALHQLVGSSVYVSPFCTGTLVASDVVVTAAHCLDTAKGGKSSFTEMSPSSLAIYVGDDPSADILSHLYLVSDLEIYSGYKRLTSTNDIAIIRLATSVTEPVTPVANLPASLGFTSADAGKTVNFAGFGETETGSSGVKLQVDLPLAGLGCTIAGCPSGSPTATQVSYSQTGEVGPCFGDSGGPLFIERSGTTYLGGVTSYGDSYCAYYGVSTRVDAFEAWIDAYIGDGDTGGGGGGGPVCGDAVCETGESCDGRSGTTSCSSDCPGVTSGKASKRYCYVGGTCEGAGCP